jgi:hypothetical protein
LGPVWSASAESAALDLSTLSAEEKIDYTQYLALFNATASSAQGQQLANKMALYPNSIAYQEAVWDYALTHTLPVNTTNDLASYLDRLSEKSQEKIPSLFWQKNFLSILLSSAYGRGIYPRERALIFGPNWYRPVNPESTNGIIRDRRFSEMVTDRSVLLDPSFMAPVFYQAITNPQDRYVTELAEDYYKIMVAKRQSLLPEHFLKDWISSEQYSNSVNIGWVVTWLVQTGKLDYIRSNQLLQTRFAFSLGNYAQGDEKIMFISANFDRVTLEKMLKAHPLDSRSSTLWKVAAAIVARDVGTLATISESKSRGDAPARMAAKIALDDLAGAIAMFDREELEPSPYYGDDMYYTMRFLGLYLGYDARYYFGYTSDIHVFYGQLRSRAISLYSGRDIPRSFSFYLPFMIHYGLTLDEAREINAAIILKALENKGKDATAQDIEKALTEAAHLYANSGNTDAILRLADRSIDAANYTLAMTLLTSGGKTPIEASLILGDRFARTGKYSLAKMYYKSAQLEEVAISLRLGDGAMATGDLQTAMSYFQTAGDPARVQEVRYKFAITAKSLSELDKYLLDFPESTNGLEVSALRKQIAEILSTLISGVEQAKAKYEGRDFEKAYSVLNETIKKYTGSSEFPDVRKAIAGLPDLKILYYKSTQEYAVKAATMEAAAKSLILVRSALAKISVVSTISSFQSVLGSPAEMSANGFVSWYFQGHQVRAYFGEYGFVQLVYIDGDLFRAF